jgi:hypothetical protein
MSVLLALVLAGAPLTLSIDSPQKEVLVGEPWKLVVSWEGQLGPREAIQTDIERLQLHVDDGKGQRLYVEDRNRRPGDPIICNDSEPTYRLQPGERLRESYVFVIGRSPGTAAEPIDLLFPKPGRYTVRAMQKRWAAPPMWSQKITVRVKEAGGRDREVIERVRGHERVLAAEDTPEQERALDELLESQPESRYLRWARLRRMREAGDAIARTPEIRRLRDEGERASDFGAFGRALGDTRRRLALDVLSSQTWGPFEPEAWAYAMYLAHNAEDEALEARIRADLLRKHPQSAAANAIARADREQAKRADESDE